jgi:hypothetical protein
MPRRRTIALFRRAVIPLIIGLALLGTGQGARSAAPPNDDRCAPEGNAPCNLLGIVNGGIAPTGAAAPEAAQPDLPAVAQNPRMGVNFANYPNNNPGSYAQARTAGAKYDRVTISMAATAGGWGGYDSLVSAATSQAIEVLGTLVQPTYPDACDTSISFGVWCVPKDLNLAWNQSSWGNWVYQAVNRYKANIHAWEIWNEPNLEFWAGSDAQYALLLKRSYQAIKAADPAATVVFGGIYRGNNIGRTVGFWNAIVADSEAAANNYFFDVMGFHLYDGGHCSTFDELGYMKSMMPVALQGKPWWITESGIRVWDSTRDGYATPYQQASWLISNYTYALYKDVKRYYFWRTTDAGDTAQPWGLMNDAGTLRPAYTAYQVAAQYLPTSFAFNVRYFFESSPNQTANRITFYGTPLGRVSVFWNVGPNPQTLTTFAVLNTGTLVAQDGSASTSTAVNGTRTFNLGAAPSFNSWNPGDCLVSSPPLILIEKDTRPPVAAMNGLPAVSNSTLVGLSWTGTDALGAGDQGAAGIWWYDVQYRVGGGPWLDLVVDTTSTARSFTGTPGVTYSFRARAYDWAGNEQTWANAAIVSTQISANATARRYFFPILRR